MSEENKGLAKRYRPMPIQVEAIEWTGNNLVEITNFLDGGKSMEIYNKFGSIGEFGWDAYKKIVEKEGLHINNKFINIGDYLVWSGWGSSDFKIYSKNEFEGLYDLIR